MRLVRQTTSSIKGKYVDYSQNMRHNQPVSLVYAKHWMKRNRYMLTEIIRLRKRIRLLFPLVNTDHWQNRNLLL
jgi:hypothetical protein